MLSCENEKEEESYDFTYDVYDSFILFTRKFSNVKNVTANYTS